MNNRAYHDSMSDDEAAALLTAAAKSPAKLVTVRWASPGSRAQPQVTIVDPAKLSVFLTWLLDVGAEIEAVR